jgi:hypothetical protein
MPSGYSGTPQFKKLGLRPGQRVCLDGAPDDWSLTDPPDGVIQVDCSEGADLIIGFFTSAADLPVRLPDLTRRIRPAGALWVAWPRRAAGHQSDITDNVIRDHALPLGVVDVKVAAIDNDWSGLRFVWRQAARGSAAVSPSP